MAKEKVNVFIGSGEASLLERKTLIYSLRKHTLRDLDIYVFNGTHNAIELNDGDPFLAPLPLHLKYKNRITEFSLYRFLIPQLCGYQGRAIYLDSDMVCLKDIGELFDTEMGGYDFLAKAEAYPEENRAVWGLSVILFDCEKCKFNLETIFKEIDEKKYSYFEFTRMSPNFLSIHPFKVGPLLAQWNSFDYWDNTTNLIHYTELDTQPWKYRDHPYGELWFEYFHEAMEAGYLSQDDVSLSIRRAYVRRDILLGNSTGEILIKKTKSQVIQQLRELKRRLVLSRF
ncbi:MAG: glycosyltransferase [Gloeobacterales cyanobacterium]